MILEMNNTQLQKLTIALFLQLVLLLFFFPSVQAQSNKQFKEMKKSEAIELGKKDFFIDGIQSSEHGLSLIHI